MNQGPYYVPAGAPPGLPLMHSDAKPPEGVYYFRVYAGVMAAIYGILAIVGLVMMAAPLFARGAFTSPGADLGSWVVGFIYGGIGTVLCVAFLIALFGGRRPWVHTMGTVLIALTMTSICCLPITIPLLIQWMKPETKQWYNT
jgi:hypothetical protein